LIAVSGNNLLLEDLQVDFSDIAENYNFNFKSRFSRSFRRFSF